MIEQVLEGLGVEIVNNNGDEIKCFCPVHHLVKGREDSNPSFYCNAHTGAWLCFSCHQRGSLPYLASLLDPDFDGLEEIILDSASERLTAVAERRKERTEEELEEPEPRTRVSERMFNKFPYPSQGILARRRLDRETAERFNIRFSPEGLCLLLPVYDFTGILLGWQEKATGYFANHPPAIEKRRSLFGWQLLGRQKRPIVVVESPLDAALLWQYEHDAVAVYGSYPSKEQMASLAKLKRPVILFFDNDDAGRTATEHAMRMLNEHSVDTFVADYPPHSEGKDPGELETTELLAAILAPARLMVDGIRRERRQR